MTDLLAAIEAPDDMERRSRRVGDGGRSGRAARRRLPHDGQPVRAAAARRDRRRASCASPSPRRTTTRCSRRLAADVSPRILRYPARLDDARA